MVVLVQDAFAKARAESLLRWLDGWLAAPHHTIASFLRFDALRLHGFQDEILDAAACANVIIVSARGEPAVLEPVKAWAEPWLIRRRAFAGAEREIRSAGLGDPSAAQRGPEFQGVLVALLERAGGDGASLARAHAELRELAAEARMYFFSQVRSLQGRAEGRLDDCLPEALFRGAGAALPWTD
ncbi:MAG: hypothetical protein HYY24_04270 [Verrucomicrobia bacterium]|nr:hypothetical protein [Verrucomicrobiota bacterium]